MAKQKGQTPAKQPQANIPASTFFSQFRIQALILIITGFIFYYNTFQNKYALDDGIVILKNEYVQSGFSGIGKILSTDSYESFYTQMHARQQLSGGRYRPLSVITFAIEQSLFGSHNTAKPVNDIAFMRHLINVLLYIFSVVLMLYLLRNFFFPDRPWIAFLAALLFLIHPLHTEVVANVKSRDEILSFLFIMLTFIAIFQARAGNLGKKKLLALLYFFLALLSKEYAITLVVLIPAIIFIAEKETLKNSILYALPFFAVAAVYMLIRLKVVGTGSHIENPDVLNNPYKFASAGQKLATKIEILNHYLRLLFWPHPLSSDYSYNTIIYKTFADPRVWTSIIVHIGLIVITIYLFVKRNIIAFALAFYLLHLFLVSNLVMDIGATMGERLVYHSSFGFVILIAMGTGYFINRVRSSSGKNVATAVVSCAFAIPALLVVMPRNADWKDDNTLFIKDASTVPNSALVNGNAGKACIDLSEMPENKAKAQELVVKSIYYLTRAVLIHNQYVNGYLNRGVAYFKLEEYEMARKDWEFVRNIYPSNPFLKTNMTLLGQVYFTKAMKIGQKAPEQAMALLEKAVDADPDNADLWYNLGGASFVSKDFEKARMAWTRTLQLKPDYTDAQRGLAALPPPPAQH